MNIINKYNTVVIAAAASLAFTSCDDYLDKLPDNRMELSSVENVNNLLVSAYSTSNPAYLYEMYSDNADLCINTSWTEADRFQRQAWQWDDISETGADETPQQMWNNIYSAIAAANASIEFIDGLSKSEQENYSAQLGEALISRAYNMFVLANTFCVAYDDSNADKNPGIPYPEHPETVVGQQYERGTLAQVYAKIDADIQRGLPLVKSAYAKPKFHFNVDASNAFAARFYLYYQKYDKCVEYATKVLGDNPSAKLRDWQAFSVLSQNGQIRPEDYISADNRANLLLQVVYSEWGAIGGNYRLGDKYAHGELLSRTETLQSNGPWGNSVNFGYKSVWSNSALSKYIFRKVPYEFEYTDLQARIGFAHSEYSIFNTDMLLVERAEAYALMGEYEKAVADINTELGAFYLRSVKLTLDGIKSFYNNLKYYTPEEPTVKKRFHTHFAIEPETQEPLLQCILHLRRILTMHEGFRWIDVKRYGIEIYRRHVNVSREVVEVSDTMLVDDPRRAIQLPQDVISAGLPANPRK